MRRDRERESSEHPRRVSTHREVDRGAESRELLGVVTHLLLREPERQPAQHDVVASRQLTVEPEAEREQRCDATPYRHATGGRRQDARDATQQRRLAGAVATDDAAYRAARYL